MSERVLQVGMCCDGGRMCPAFAIELPLRVLGKIGNEAGAATCGLGPGGSRYGFRYTSLVTIPAPRWCPLRDGPVTITLSKP